LEDGAGLQQWYWHRATKSIHTAADIIHLPGLSHDGMTGMDPVSLHAGTFQRASTLEKYQVQYLSRGTLMRGSVEIQGALTDEQMAQFRSVLRRFKGPDGEDDILILTEGAKLNNS